MTDWSIYDDEPYPGPIEVLPLIDAISGPSPLDQMLSAYVGDIEYYPDKLWSEKELVGMTREELTRLGPLDKVYTLDPIGVMYKQMRPPLLTMSSSDRINWTYEWTLE